MWCVLVTISTSAVTPPQRFGIVNSESVQPTILVTGGAGFIGSTLVDALLRMGYRVRVLDNLETGYIQFLDFLHPNLEFLHGDVLKKETVYDSMKNVTGVFHLAAATKSGKFPYEATLNVQTSAIGTANLLEAAVSSTTVKRFIYVGSSTYYGDQDFDLDDPFSPSSSVASSKFMGELIAANYDKLFNLPTVAVRFFGVFGPRQTLTGPYAPTRFLNREDNIPAFLHVHEAVNGLIRAYHSSIRGTAILLSPREEVSRNELAHMINIHNPSRASYADYTSSFDSLETTARLIHRSFSDGELDNKAPFWDIFAEELSEKFPGWLDMPPEAQSAVIGAYIAEGNSFPDF